MNQVIKNKTIVITGASSGFGLHTSKLFAQNGWNVYSLVKSDIENESNRLIMELTKQYPSIKVLQADVTNDVQIELAIQKIISEVGQIDVLINNAGFGFLGPIETFSIDQVKEQYEINVFGYLRMIKAVVPLMREKNTGTIINISSVNGLVSFPLYGIYSSSKFAIETISEVLNFELEPFGVKVVIVEPGAFDTNFSQNVKFPNELDSSVYADWAKKCFDKILGSEESKSFLKFTNPEIVSKLIYKIANSKNPRLRYRVGIDTLLYYLLRRLLPHRVWKWAINKVYKWTKLQ